MGFFSSIKKIFSSPVQNDENTNSNIAKDEDKISVDTDISDTQINNEQISNEQIGNEQNDAIILRLRQSESKLSTWLEIILQDVTIADSLLWQRLDILLKALETKPSESAKFITNFKTWLKHMDYNHVDEFRSELQYRLALALELEDEEDERNRLVVKLNESLSKTREQFSRQLDKLFSSNANIDQNFWDELEELFLLADVGYETANTLVQRLQQRALGEKNVDSAKIKDFLQIELEEIFRTPRRITAINPPEVVLMVGVNGVGKTTTIAKLAHRAKMQGKKVLIAAADTFRAAAAEQLKIWADRVGVDFHAKEHGADPAAVAYEAMDLALKQHYDIVFIDTAGRLQTKINLMEELSKIQNVLAKKHDGAPHRSILVIDATTGQNALSQTKLFKETTGIDEIIITKLDGTAKGGIAIALSLQYAIPITYIGLGEKLEDLKPFNGIDYTNAILGFKQ